jgi:hypothetical protein
MQTTRTKSKEQVKAFETSTSYSIQLYFCSSWQEKLQSTVGDEWTRPLPRKNNKKQKNVETKAWLYNEA